ncbi:MAG: hypothetical protein WBC63_10315 [Candidatus Bipolaricaulia bacterium]
MVALAVLVGLVFVSLPLLGTEIDSANGQPWDVHDQFEGGASDGSVCDGGDDAFDDWGGLQLRVLDGGGGVLEYNLWLDGFEFAYSNRRWDTTTPVSSNGIVVNRSLYAPAGTDYLRYIDSFVNGSGATRTVYVGWGDGENGDLGSDRDTTVYQTSSGDRVIEAADTWAVTFEGDGDWSDWLPRDIAAQWDPPLGYAFRDGTDTTFLGVGDSYNGYPSELPWTGNLGFQDSDNDELSFVYTFTLAPGESASLAYFLYRGLVELEEGPLGQPAPAAGAEKDKAKALMQALVANPYFADLSQAEMDAILNWMYVVPRKAVRSIHVVPMGEEGTLLDRVLSLEPSVQRPAPGHRGLQAVYGIGETIVGDFNLFDADGDVIRNAGVFVELSKLDLSAVPYSQERVLRFMIRFSREHGTYHFEIDTAGLAPGYYDLRLAFPDGSSETMRIELVTSTE